MRLGFELGAPLAVRQIYLANTHKHTDETKNLQTKARVCVTKGFQFTNAWNPKVRT